MSVLRSASVGLVALALLPACAAPDDLGSATEDASQFKGAKFTDESGALTLYAQLLDGKKATTKNQRYAKVSAKRGGKWAAFFCSNHGSLPGDGSRELVLSCGSSAETVSNDDDESLGFDIRMSQKASGEPVFVLRNVDYVGDGTFLGKELEVLVGEVEDFSYGPWEGTDYALKVVSRSDMTRDPFSLAGFAADAVAPLIGTSIWYDDVEASLKVRKLSFGFDSDLLMSLSATLSKSGDLSAYAPNGISLLAQPGVLASGYASAAELQARAKSAFASEAPVEVDLEATFENALAPLGGPVDGLARAVELADVPDAVRAKLEQAGAAIEAREVEGTDYAAAIEGYYAVFESAEADEPVGYAVWGTGAGEPDFHDGIVIGFDLAGNEVYNVEDSG